MVRKTEKSGKKKSSLKERKERAEKMTEDLQKELDALVPPILVRKEHPEERGEVQFVKKPETVSKKPIEADRLSVELIKDEQTKPAKEKVNPWGIVIGETD